MATDVTKADLLGTGGTMQLKRDGTLTDQQVTAPPGGTSVLVASLGKKGRLTTFACTFRASDATIAAARTTLNTTRDALIDYESGKTELNLFVGDSEYPGVMYVGQFNSVVIDSLSFGPIHRSPASGAVTLIQEAEITFRKLL